MWLLLDNRLKLRYKHIVFFFLILAFIVPEALASTRDPILTDITVTNTRDNLLIYMTCENAFSEKIQKAISSGVPTSFTFYITLYKTRNFWLDKKIVDKEITHAIKFNNLKNEYIIQRSWKGSKPDVVQSFKEAKELMSIIESLNISSLDRLKKGESYQIGIKVKLSKIKLPFYLHYVLLFVSFWDVETDWYTIDFIY